jgi:hypothetical protein
MKKLINLSLTCLLFFLSIFLIGCGNSVQKHNEVAMNEALQIVKSFANEYGLDESLITKTTTEWSNPTAGYDHDYTWYSK